jgi:hypothetical protein
MAYAFVYDTWNPSIVFWDHTWDALRHGNGYRMVFSSTPHRHWDTSQPLRLFAVDTAQRLLGEDHPTFAVARLAAAGGVLREDLLSYYCSQPQSQRPLSQAIRTTVHPCPYSAAYQTSQIALALHRDQRRREEERQAEALNLRLTGHLGL